MMELTVILLLIAWQALIGFGILTLFRIWLKPGMFIPLCVLTGILVFSLVPFVMELLRIPLTQFAVFFSLAVVTILLNLKAPYGLKMLTRFFPGKKMNLEVYDVFIFLVIAVLVFVSAWRCFYYPPFPRDLTSGAEVLAEYAVREKTMINSVFTVNLESTNNPFKPPFITSLQVIYKYAGFPFGQIWLSGIFLFFLLFLYQALSLVLHRLISGVLVIFFIAIPEMYAYTFMALFDYSNAVYFSLSLFFLIRYFKTDQRKYLAFAGLLMGGATYIRSETLVLAAMLMPGIFLYHTRKWDGLKKMLGRSFHFFVPVVIFYLVSVTLYLNFYLPVRYKVENLINPDLLNLEPFWDRFLDMNNQLIFHPNGVNYFGYFIFLFLFILLLDLVLVDRWNKSSRNWIFAIIVVYLGLPVLGYLLPLMNLDHSTKRGMFKLFPLMLLYLGNSGCLAMLSENIRRWEGKEVSKDAD
jgi:hypothetical protein